MAQSALLNVLTQAATRAGRGLSRDFGEIQSLQSSVNGPGDFAEKAQEKAAKSIRENLLKARPAFPMVMDGREYQGAERQNRWLVSSLSGIANYRHGVNYFCVSIALEREGKIVAGVVYNPAIDRLFTAERGKGAYLNDRRIRVGARQHLPGCLVGFAAADKNAETYGRILKDFASVSSETAVLRNFGCFALDITNVAEGSFDGCWGRNANYWSLAGAAIVLREAGGTITGFAGSEDIREAKDHVAGNFNIHPALVKALTNN